MSNRSFTGNQCSFIKSELQALLLSGAIKEVDRPPTCISPISCVPKNGWKYCLIVDLCQINQFCNEDINALIEYVQPHD